MSGHVERAAQHIANAHLNTLLDGAPGDPINWLKVAQRLDGLGLLRTDHHAAALSACEAHGLMWPNSPVPRPCHDCSAVGVASLAAKRPVEPALRVAKVDYVSKEFPWCVLRGEDALCYFRSEALAVQYAALNALEVRP